MRIVLTILSWVLALFICAVFLPSLFFKFGDIHGFASQDVIDISRNIFQSIDRTVNQWFGLTVFEPYGRYGVGGAELLASILLLIPATRFFGAGLAFLLMVGAVFFHLFTDLGVEVVSEPGAAADSSLFFTAVAVVAASAVLMVIERART